MNIGEKVAYLKGLAEGLELDIESKNGKLISGILDVLENIAETINELQEDTENISGYVEDLDSDLGEVEEIVYGEKPISFPPNFKHKHKHKHGLYGGDDNIDMFDADGEENETVELKCPICGDEIFVEIDMLLDNDAIICPNCNKSLTVVDENGVGGGCCGSCSGENNAFDVEIDELDAEINEQLNEDE